MRYTLKDLQAEYPDDSSCLELIMKQQFGGTRFVCPGCDCEASFHQMTKRRAYACQECGHHIYPCVGTIFEKSRTKLTLWFYAMYLMTSTRHGVPAKELERQLGVTYKCAWRMAHELRKLMATADIPSGPVSGHVEIDETFVGGKNIGKGWKRRHENKTIVMGIVERDGRVVAGPIPAIKGNFIAPIIEQNVAPGTTITTDEHPVYRVLEVSPYQHETVNHHAKEYARGIHHTNTIEGHWSLLKRAIRGTHTHVSAKHLWKYVSEFSYRRNNRASHRDMFNRLVSAFSLPRLVET